MTMLREKRPVGRPPLSLDTKRMKLGVSLKPTSVTEIRKIEAGNLSAGIETLLRSSRHKNLSASHKRAPKMEQSISKKLGAHLVPGSGVGQMKGDIRKKGIARIECKTTMRKSFPITVELIRKIEGATIGTAEVPAIIVEFNDGLGKVLGTCAVVPMYVLEDLLSR